MPLIPFWQISSSSSRGCGILRSVSLWHGSERRKRVPCCSNYITTSSAAPRPLTQLSRENINFIVPVERMWSLKKTRAQLRVEDRPPACGVCMCQGMHNVSGMKLTLNSWPSGLLSWFASNMLMTLWDCSHSSGDMWLVAESSGFFLFLYIPHFHSFSVATQKLHRTLNEICRSCHLVNRWFSPVCFEPHTFDRPYLEACTSTSVPMRRHVAPVWELF